MARLRLFGPARVAAGVGVVEVPAATVGEVIAMGEEQFGADFTAVLAVSGLWLNGRAASADQTVGQDDEVAVIPPVSGGCG